MKDITKRILFIIIFFIFVLSIFILLNDEDFYKYSKKTIEINEYINGNVFIIAEIEDQLLEAVDDIESDMKLAYAEYIFYSDTKVEAKFYYSKPNENNNNKIVTLKLNVCGKILSSAIFETGIVKRVALTYSGPLTNNKEIDIYDRYSEFIKGKGLLGAVSDLYYPIHITVTSDGIYIV